MSSIEEDAQSGPDAGVRPQRVTLPPHTTEEILQEPEKRSTPRPKKQPPSLKCPYCHMSYQKGGHFQRHLAIHREYRGWREVLRENTRQQAQSLQTSSPVADISYATTSPNHVDPLDFYQHNFMHQGHHQSSVAASTSYYPGLNHSIPHVTPNEVQAHYGNTGVEVVDYDPQAFPSSSSAVIPSQADHDINGTGTLPQQWQMTPQHHDTNPHAQAHLMRTRVRDSRTLYNMNPQAGGNDF